MTGGVVGAIFFYLNWLFSRRLLVKKVRSAQTFFSPNLENLAVGKSATH
jgi:hypothetical protein